MSDRYTVIHPDTLEAMRRAGHVAKLEARIEKLEDELLHCFHRINALQTALQAVIRYAGNTGDDYLADKARKALEGKDD